MTDPITKQDDLRLTPEQIAELSARCDSMTGDWFQDGDAEKAMQALIASHKFLEAELAALKQRAAEETRRLDTVEVNKMEIYREDHKDEIEMLRPWCVSNGDIREWAPTLRAAIDAVEDAMRKENPGDA